jgi:hypothetical protein
MGSSVFLTSEAKAETIAREGGSGGTFPWKAQHSFIQWSPLLGTPPSWMRENIYTVIATIF